MGESRKAKRSTIRRRIYSVVATTLEHDYGSLGAEWVDELAEELDIPRVIVVEEAERISALLRRKSDHG